MRGGDVLDEPFLCGLPFDLVDVFLSFFFLRFGFGSSDAACLGRHFSLFFPLGFGFDLGAARS